MTIKCIAFDLDNTLWECDPLIIKAEKKFYAWVETNYPKISGMFSADALVENRMAFMQLHPNLHHNLTRLRKKWMRNIASDVGGLGFSDDKDFEAEFIEKGFQVFWQERNNVIFYEGVIDMLESLSKQYSLGVITNGNASVDFIGIGEYFDFSLSSEAAGVAKPHEDIFHQGLALAKVTEEEMIYVGDDTNCDVLGPQKQNIRAIWYNPTLRPWPGGKTPTGVISHHNQLEDKICNI